MNAVSEGTDISAADEATVEQQINQKQIKVLVYNSQNTPPNVLTLLNLAKAQGIPTVTITETLEPASDTFQEWQSAQLQALETALALATGK
jgi:zinc/manganese transport system substrate-binding protein